MIRVLANDGLQTDAINDLKLLGVEVITDHYDKDKLKDILKDFNVVIVRSATKIDSEILRSATNSKLKLIIRAGVGIDNIDVD